MSLSRVGTFFRAVRPVFRNNVRQSSGHGSNLGLILKEHKGTFNDLPVPTGSWQENYNRRNAKFNVQLGISLVVFAATLVFVLQSNVFYLHSIGDVRKVKIEP